jgi:hypothetical protein
MPVAYAALFETSLDGLLPAKALRRLEKTKTNTRLCRETTQTNTRPSRETTQTNPCHRLETTMPHCKLLKLELDQGEQKLMHEKNRSFGATVGKRSADPLLPRGR